MINKPSTSLQGNKPRIAPALHPAWVALIRHCQEMGFGEIERPVAIDVGGLEALAQFGVQALATVAAELL